MKDYQKGALILFLLLCCLIYKVEGYLKVTPFFDKIIFIDPGHGGLDPGAQYKNLYEKTINLEISKLLKIRLEELGAIVYLTREGDYDLAVPNAYLRKRSDLFQRAKMINKSDCDLYLSIHLNASQFTNWQGAQVFYEEVNEENKKIATIIQDSFKRHLGSKRKTKKIQNLYMYKRVEKPGVLLEIGFISNPHERYILRKKYYQERIVRSLIEALIVYFEL
ncbi:MAG: N-acetylmuramoyl-L-alanine amidase [Bacilli bacterium]